MRRSKIFISIFLGATLGLVFCFNNLSLGYDTKKGHPKLTQAITNLYNQNHPDQKISQKEIEWLIRGAVDEDVFPRYVNHFYDPINNRPWLGRNLLALTAKEWAENSMRQKTYFSSKGDQSWQKAIDSYIKGDKQSSFIALGHVLHLIEDMSVPDHTRNDTHLPYIDESPYEKWVEKYLSEKSILELTNLNLINCESLSLCFQQIALYSNNNFFSRSTINKNFLLPTIEKKEKKEFIKMNGDRGEYIFSKLGNAEIKLVQIIEERKWAKNKNAITYRIDDEVVYDYFSLLAPKAVSYGAGVIDLFFKEVEKKKQEEQQKNWWDKTKNWYKNNINKFSGSLLNLAGNSDNANTTSFSNQNLTIDQNALNNLGNQQQNQTIQNQTAEQLKENQIVSNKPEFKPQGSENNNNQDEKSENLGNKEPINQQENKPVDGQGNEEQENNIENKKGNFKQETLPLDSKNQELENENNNVIDDGKSAIGSPENNDSSYSNNQNEENFNNLLPDIISPETFATSTLFSNNQTIATSTAIFTFSSSEKNSTFQCQLDNASSTPCVSPIEYNNLSETSHEFKVWAIDQANNQDQTPEIFNWTVGITLPQISGIIVSDITSDSAKITFTTDKATYSRIEYGINSSYGEGIDWGIATTTNHSILLSSLLPATEYHFRIWVKDDLGNDNNSADNYFTTAQAPHVVISEIQTSGAGGANDEWIELYNPSSQSVDLSLWSIQYRGGAGANFYKKNFAAGNSIATNGFFLAAYSNYTGGVPADLVYSDSSFSMSGTGGTIFLVNNNVKLTSATSTSIIDKISYGSGANLFPEGTVFSQAPLAGESLERKANATSTAESLSAGADKWQGNNYDNNNNSQDFVLQNSPTPQNSQSLTEPRDSFPFLAIDSVWPIFQQNEKRQARISVGPTAQTAQLFFSNESYRFNTPPIISQNKIFIGSETGLHSFDLNGNQLWVFPSGRSFSLVAASNGNIYLGSINGIFSFSSEGILQWKYSITGAFYLNIDKNGTIYAVSSNKLYAFSPDGKLKWIFNVNEPPLNRIVDGMHFGFPAIDNARERIYANMGEYFYAINFSGSLAWDFRNNASFQPILTHIFTTPAIGDDGTIYICSDGEIFPSGGFYALNPNGTVKWFNNYGYSSNAISSPAIGADNTVYFIANTGGAAATELIALNKQTGTKEWNVSTFDVWVSSPLIANNNIYFAAGREIRVFDFDGNMIWHWNEGSGSYINECFGGVDENGNLYFAVTGKIYKIGS